MVAVWMEKAVVQKVGSGVRSVAGGISVECVEFLAEGDK